MKLKALALALLVAGFGSTYAFAKGNPGHGNGHNGTTSHGQAKLAVCHKAGKSGRWVKIVVANKAAQNAHLKHGDVLPDASGNCPGATTTTTESTTTVATTTDDQTTTAATTTEQTTTDDENGDQNDDSQGDDSDSDDNSNDDSQ